MEDKKITLDNASISALIAEIEAWLAKQKQERKNITHLSLSIEEYLLRWQDKFGSEQKVDFSAGKRLGQPYISLTLTGERLDPTVPADEEHDWSSRLLDAMGLTPSYAYRRGANRLTLRLKRTKKSASALLIAIALALVIGLLGKYLIPAQAAALAEELVTPIRATLLGLLSAVAVPIIFFSVLLGICETGSASEFGLIGNRLLRGFIIKPLFPVAAAAVIITPMFALNYSDTGFSLGQITGTLQMILDIFPDSMFSPFTTGNTLQVLVIAIAAGVALLILGDTANEVKALARKLYTVVELLLQWVSRLIAPILFLVLLETILTSELSAFAQLWKPLVFSVAFIAASMLLRILWTAIRYRLSPVMLFKKMSPVMLRTFITSSSSSALGESLECSMKRLGVHRKIAYFGLPTGSVMFKPLSAVYLLICVYFCAETFAVACSVAWIVLTCITVTLLAMALPPVPGGGVACYTVLFAQLGIPAEAIAFAITLDLILDRFSTTANTAILHMDLIDLAKKQDLLDTEALKR